MKDGKKMLLIAVLLTLVSEIYWNLFVPGFRISFSVILLPILLMTIGKSVSSFRICAATAVSILVFRLVWASSGLADVPNLLHLVLPNAMFYLCYGLIFSLMLPNKHTCSYTSLIFGVFISDFVSNVLELCIFYLDGSATLTLMRLGALALIALFRALLACVFLIIESQYRTLLKKEEHENRYRRLFLMTTGLKNEVYFMRKNSEEIESVMGNAYRLYEKLSAMDDVPEDMKRMSLSIARDVHEIKKDYIRIIQGIESEISEEYDEKRMSLSDLMNILEVTSYTLFQGKSVKINLDFQCHDDFVTDDHYELMAILKNIVNNAAEAIDGAKKAAAGTITLIEKKVDDMYEFRITDNGPGISARHLPNIFKMGYSTKFDYKTGNIFRGVGLYGVKGTVEEKFGGTIDVESQVGVGTTFTIRIPVESLEIQ